MVWTSLLLVLGACGVPQSDVVPLACEVRAETPLGADELTPAGFSAADVAARVVPVTGPFYWTAHPEGVVHVEPTVDLGSARFLDRIPPTDAGAYVPDLNCAGEIVVDGTLGLRTEEGFLDEVAAMALHSADGLVVSAEILLDPDDLVGSYVVTERSPSAQARLLVNPVWTLSAASGEVLLADGEGAATAFVAVGSW